MKMNLSNPAISLLEDELEFREISKSQAARDMKIPRSRLTDICKGRKGFSIDTALRLEAYLGVRAGLWLDLQQDFDLRVARLEKGESIAGEVEAA